MFEKIVLASGNSGKLKEFSRLFADLNIEVLPQSQFNTPECPEPYHTFVENALAKARHAAKYSGLPALADDSGICTNALNGAPGIFSARYAGENPKSDAATTPNCLPILPIKTIKAVTTSACSSSSATKTTRNPSSPKASGTDNGRQKPQVQTASATTRISIWPNMVAPPPSLVLKSKMPKATAPKHCVNC